MSNVTMGVSSLGQALTASLGSVPGMFGVMNQRHSERVWVAIGRTVSGLVYLPFPCYIPGSDSDNELLETCLANTLQLDHDDDDDIDVDDDDDDDNEDDDNEDDQFDEPVCVV